jgi:hypothetical protein
MSDDQRPLGTPLGWTPSDQAAATGDPGEVGADAVDAVADATAGADEATPDIAPEGVVASPVAAAPTGAQAPSGSPGAAPDGATGVEGWTEPSAPPATKRRGSRNLIIGLVVIAVVVGAGVIGRDFLSGNASDLKVGDCFDDPVAAGGTATAVESVQHHPCSDPHQFEVFASLDFPAEKGAAFPGNSGFDTFVGEKCDPAFTAYVGVPETGSSLTWAAYQPLEAGWSKGDREITCFLQDRSLAKLTGTVKGSNR